MLKIGFSTKYFTLWDVTSVTTQDYIDMSFTYIQNLSLDESKAIEKAKSKGVTNLEVDSDLKGMNRSWKRREYIKKQYDENQFSFGRYEGEIITENDDSDYIKWYYRETKNDIAMNRVVELDSNYGIYDGGLLLLSKIEELETRDFEKELIRNDGKYSVLVTGNPDYLGIITENGISFKFKNTASRWYGNFEYFVPTLKGKGKLVKNRVIEFECKYDSEYDYFVIDDFKVMKK